MAAPEVSGCLRFRVFHEISGDSQHNYRELLREDIMFKSLSFRKTETSQGISKKMGFNS